MYLKVSQDWAFFEIHLCEKAAAERWCKVRTTIKAQLRAAASGKWPLRLLLEIHWSTMDIEPLEKNKATHKPSLKAPFFLSVWANSWALHHSPSRHKDRLCQHEAAWKRGVFQKWGLSAEKGQALPQDTTRSQKTFAEVQNMSRIQTRDTRKHTVSWGKQRLIITRKSVDKVCGASQTHRINLNRENDAD